MNIIFAGTPEFSAVSLQSLVDAGYRVPLVITQPDRRAGRGMSVSKSEVKEMATGLGIETYQPSSLKSPEVLEKLKSVNADLMIVVAFGKSYQNQFWMLFVLDVLMSMLLYYPDGEAPRQFSAQSWRAIQRRVSASCGWRKGLTPDRFS